MRDAQSRCDRSWRVERDIKTNDHTAVDIDGEGNPRAPNWQSLFIIDDDDIELCVIDLHEVEWALSRVEDPRPRHKAIQSVFSVRTARKTLTIRNRRDPQAHRVWVGSP